MAIEAQSPFGITWGYLGLGVVGLLSLLTIGLVLAYRGLLLGPAIGVAAWTFFTIGAPVVVPIESDPQGAECWVDPFGDNPGRVVPWDTECGRALRDHLVVSVGPSIVMVGGVLVATTIALKRRTPALPDSG